MEIEGRIRYLFKQLILVKYGDLKKESCSPWNDVIYGFPG